MKKPKPTTQFAVGAVFGIFQAAHTFDGPDDTDPEFAPAAAYQATSTAGDTGLILPPVLAHPILEHVIRLWEPNILRVTERPGFLDTGGTTATG